MLEIKAVEPLEAHVVRLTLSDGSIVVRDLSELLDGVGVFERISVDDAAFREVFVDYGTLVWPGEVDIAPETLIWDGRPPADEGSRRPEPFLRPRNPRDIEYRPESDCRADGRRRGDRLLNLRGLRDARAAPRRGSDSHVGSRRPSWRHADPGQGGRRPRRAPDVRHMARRVGGRGSSGRAGRGDRARGRDRDRSRQHRDGPVLVQSVRRGVLRGTLDDLGGVRARDGLVGGQLRPVSERSSPPIRLIHSPCPDTP